MASRGGTEEGFEAMAAALRRFLAARRAGADEDAAALAALPTAEIERRLERRLARAAAALGQRADALPGGAGARAALYDRLARTAGAQMRDEDADAFRIALALDLSALEAELESRGV